MNKRVAPAALNVYERVAADIEDLIARKLLRVGDKLPSLRRMHEQTGYSVSSCLQGYLLLEARGVIEARPKSGYYVLYRERESAPAAVAPVAPSGRPASREPLDELVIDSFIRATTDPECLQLAEAAPGSELLPARQLLRILGQVTRASRERLLLFESPQGSLELRREISKRASLSGLRIAEREITITSGGFESWNLALRATARPGATVLVDSPTYFGAHEIIRNLGMKPLAMPTSPESGIDFGRLDKLLLRQKGIAVCLTMPHFAKPYVPALASEDQARFVRLLAARDIAIIEDDIYGDFHFNPKRARTLKSFDETGHVLHCGSFSKTVSPGFRLSWVGTGKYQAAFLRQKFLTSISAPTLQQRVLAQYLQIGGHDRHLRRMRTGLLRNLQDYTDRIEQVFPQGTRVHAPAAGPVLWIELPPRVSAVAIYHEALARKIVTGPGPVFTLNGELPNFIRLSFGAAYSPRIARALQELGRLATVQ
jgi:DNA-binding transcriptional MocR family regulator